MKKSFLRISFAGALLSVALYLGLTEAPIDPAAYLPRPAPPLLGLLAPNHALTQAGLLAKGQIHGPEDMAIDGTGEIYTGTGDGKIIRIRRDESVETFAETGGRPLGLQFDRHGNLIVADAVKGLLSISRESIITTLTTSAEGVPFKLTDAMDIAGDGRIYFSDASSKWRQSEYLYDLLEAKPYGRLLCYDPATQSTTAVMRDLYFANGVALSQDEDFVLVNETYRYRIARHWLKGEKAGTSEVFIDNLPGFPDGISSNRRGTFWLALFTVRNPIMDHLHPYPFAKKILSRLPKLFWPKPKPYGLVLALDEQGRVQRSLHDPTGKHLFEITSAREHEGFLYCGTLDYDRIGKYKLE